MKTKLIAFLVAVCLTGGSSVWAKPERFQLKSDAQEMREKAGRTKIKNIDPNLILDPEAKKAIKEILNYLGLQTR